MAQVLDLFIIGSPRVGVDDGNRRAKRDARRAAHGLSEAHGEPADPLTETDIRTRERLTGE